ncbi:von Willebrand factor type A domain protein [Anaerohalosphaera lusitana]|uniref:von Willebrand factor type A domain protein n=1 Tax=Anaerohalosphaera lusitana TaxID=1936003 RepID=A0A1U9NLU5_9BACT|nr:vWA domain-containing protein [Anaerohalosphaera lusitana]AQT68704.1 von Willebrand factor type A domain protein [Anaerohalosphaera lusitana]
MTSHTVLPSTRPKVFLGSVDNSGSSGTLDRNGSTRQESAQDGILAFCQTRTAINPDDLFVGIGFNNKERVFCEPVPVCRIDAIRSAVKSLRPRGGTRSAGLEAANYYADHYRKHGCKVSLIILTDGHISMSSKHMKIAESLKSRGVVIDTIGIGGQPRDVDEQLLKDIATTDPDGYIHYRFIDDSETLIRHYENLAAGLRIENDS